MTLPNGFRIIPPPEFHPERMMRLRSLTLALLALFAVPAACSAGPIKFGYTPYGSPSLYGTDLSPGELTFSLAPSGVTEFPQTTGGEIELGNVQFGSSPGPLGTDTYTASRQFSVGVTIKDMISGQLADLTLYGGAVDDWTFRAWDGRWMNDYHQLQLNDQYSSNFDSTSVILGTTRYTLTVRPDAGDQIGVYTLTAFAASPEPGTFALAALGIVPLGLRRLRRK